MKLGTNNFLFHKINVILSVVIVNFSNKGELKYMLAIMRPLLIGFFSITATFLLVFQSIEISHAFQALFSHNTYDK
jgi:hypothetical protein